MSPGSQSPNSTRIRTRFTNIIDSAPNRYAFGGELQIPRFARDDNSYMVSLPVHPPATFIHGYLLLPSLDRHCRLVCPFDELPFHLVARQVAGTHQFDGRRNAQRRFDLALNRQLERSPSRRLATTLRDNLQRRLDSRARLVKYDLNFPGCRRIETRNHILDRRGKNIDAQHDQHVVHTPDATQFETGTATRTRSTQHLNPIARAKTQQGDALPLQAGVHQLPSYARFVRKALAGLGINDFHDHTIRSVEVHP